MMTQTFFHYPRSDFPDRTSEIFNVGPLALKLPTRLDTERKSKRREGGKEKENENVAEKKKKRGEERKVGTLSRSFKHSWFPFFP